MATPGWSGPIEPSTLPPYDSSLIGDQAAYLIPGGAGSTLMQFYCRGDRFYGRAAPVKADGTPDWTTGWTSLSIAELQLPGEGPINTLTAFILPGGTLMQALWRGNKGYWRSVDVNGGDWFSLNPDGASHVGLILEDERWIPNWQGSDLHNNDDYYAVDWSGGNRGDPVRAMAPGLVLYAGQHPGGWAAYGKQVVVWCLHEPGFVYRYAHLDQTQVSPGDIVGFHTTPGTVGSSGTSSVHLHGALYKSVTPQVVDVLANGGAPNPIPLGPPKQPTAYAARFLDRCAFVADVTIPDGMRVAPGARIEKIWRLRNSGTTDWGQKYKAIRVAGSFGPSEVPLAQKVELGQESDVPATMQVPTQPGTHQATYRIARLGRTFGEPFWVKVIV
ncbi:NBR1-Ig-like domain-containing protein [Hyalangium gracile]|uniref:NBR1-Ig-like domain-containing protein n=1 Tax=Hyalangium gracile TaxID=394092 RepID=UPI001CCEB669|nr:NBR1-Ig-like domain-containing protein [Hyalangium gracile]